MDTTRKTLDDYNRRPKHLNKIDEDYARKLGKHFLPENDSGRRKNYIKDIPILMTVDGTIVCIPKLAEMGLISVVGRTGTGKTLHSGYLIDNIFWLWGDAIIDMNDSQEETVTWAEPNDVLEFKYRFKKLGQVPMPLPIIYVFPNFDKLKIKEEILKDRNYVTISIPFEEIINNIERYIPELGATLKYIIEKKPDLLKVETEADLNRVIESIQCGKATESVQSKAKASFHQLMSEGILNITDPTAPPELKVQDLITKSTIYKGNPMTAIMKAECIPSFITSDLYSGKYKDAIFAYWIRSLFEESLKGTMMGKRVWIYFDELNKVVDIRPENNSPATEKALGEVSTRGRNNQISMLYATQFYHNIPRVIRSQTKYAIIFFNKDPDAAKEICNDFVLEKKWQNKIRELKKYEAVVATTEHFVCYKGNKRWDDSGPFFGMTFPALHKNKFLNRTL